MERVGDEYKHYKSKTGMFLPAFMGFLKARWQG